MFWERNKRHAPTLALALGFLWDSLTLGRPDRLFDNAVLLIYLLIAGGSIILLNIRARRAEAPLSLLTLIQFAFGNLASAMFILYSKSGTLEGNLVFFVLLVGFLIGNEFVKGRYAQLHFHIAAYYLLVFSYLMIVVPTLMGEIGERVLIASGTLSVLFIAAFISILSVITPVLKDQVKKTIVSIAAIFITFNALYLLNLIPPVPLALRHLDVYHAIERTGFTYTGTYEPGPWLQFWRNSSATFHRTGGESVYCFSSIFAPAGLEAPIYHRWERYDEKRGGWTTMARTRFPIIGGREEGYRGFTIKSTLEKGSWRCSVETERGALIGRRSFEVVEVSARPELSRQTL